MNDKKRKGENEGREIEPDWAGQMSEWRYGMEMARWMAHKTEYIYKLYIYIRLEQTGGGKWKGKANDRKINKQIRKHQEKNTARSRSRFKMGQYNDDDDDDDDDGRAWVVVVVMV